MASSHSSSQRSHPSICESDSNFEEVIEKWLDDCESDDDCDKCDVCEEGAHVQVCLKHVSMEISFQMVI